MVLCVQLNTIKRSKKWQKYKLFNNLIPPSTWHQLSGFWIHETNHYPFFVHSINCWTFQQIITKFFGGGGETMCPSGNMDEPEIWSTRSKTRFLHVLSRKSIEFIEFHIKNKVSSFDFYLFFHISNIGFRLVFLGEWYYSYKRAPVTGNEWGSRVEQWGDFAGSENK